MKNFSQSFLGQSTQTTEHTQAKGSKTLLATNSRLKTVVSVLKMRIYSLQRKDKAMSTGESSFDMVDKIKSSLGMVDENESSNMIKGVESATDRAAKGINAAASSVEAASGRAKDGVSTAATNVKEGTKLAFASTGEGFNTAAMNVKEGAKSASAYATKGVNKAAYKVEKATHE